MVVALIVSTALVLLGVTVRLADAWRENRRQRRRRERYDRHVAQHGVWTWLRRPRRLKQLTFRDSAPEVKDA